MIRTRRRLAQEPFSRVPAFAAPAAEGQTGAQRRRRGNAGAGWEESGARVTSCQTGSASNMLKSDYDMPPRPQPLPLLSSLSHRVPPPLELLRSSSLVLFLL